MYHVSFIDFVHSSQAGIPQALKEIVGNGNCLFKSISFFVSGTEDNYDIIWAFLLQLMLESRDLAVGLFLINDIDNCV